MRSACKECRGGATSSKRARKAPVLVVQAELATDEEEEAGPSAGAARRGRRMAEPASKRRRVDWSSSDEAEYENEDEGEAEAAEGAWESDPISRGADVDVDVIDGFVFTSSSSTL